MRSKIIICKIFIIIFIIILCFLMLNCATINTIQGDSYFNQKKYDKAIEYYEKNISKHNENYVLYMLNLAMAYYLNYDLENAAKTFIAALKANEEEESALALLKSKSSRKYRMRKYEKVMVHFYLGFIFQQLNMIEDAIIEFKKVNQIDSKYSLTHYFMGESYNFNNHYDDAMIEYKKVLKNNNYFVYANLELGLLERRLGYNDESATNINKFLEYQPESLLSEKIYNLGQNDIGIIENNDGVLYIIIEQFAAQGTWSGRDRIFGEIYSNGEYIGQTEILEEGIQQKLKQKIKEELKAMAIEYAKDVAVRTLTGGLIGGTSEDEKRQWDKIPDTIHFFKTYIPEGIYNITVRFIDIDGNELSIPYLNYSEFEIYSNQISFCVDRI